MPSGSCPAHYRLIAEQQDQKQEISRETRNDLISDYSNLSHPFDIGAEGAETFIDAFVAAVDLVNAVDFRCSVSR